MQDQIHTTLLASDAADLASELSIEVGVLKAQIVRMQDQIDRLEILVAEMRAERRILLGDHRG